MLELFFVRSTFFRLLYFSSVKVLLKWMPKWTLKHHCLRFKVSDIVRMQFPPKQIKITCGNVKPSHYSYIVYFSNSTRCVFCNDQYNAFFGLVWWICLLTPWVGELHGNMCDWIKFKLFYCTELIFYRRKCYEIMIIIELISI